MTATAPVTVTDLSAGLPAGVEVAAATHIGPVRTENQDVFAATPMSGGAVGVLVADGMGGMPGGGAAAAVAATEAVRVLAAGSAGERTVAAALGAANAAVGALRETSGGQPGTPLTVVALAGRVAHVAHAGDSRAYLVRAGLATPLTDDHSWVGDRVRSGELPPGSERRHQRRNIITRAVMGDPVEPMLTSLTLEAGDQLVLCSDGFWEPLDDEQIGALVATPGPLAAVVERSAQAALDAGGTDNVTLVVLRLER